MRILGLSNPNFLGVTVATKAICTDWLAAPHMALPYECQKIATDIFVYGPDIVVVGGWSNGYMQMLTEMRRAGHKDFPIVAVSHSTPFHGAYFHEDWQAPEYEAAFRAGLIDIMGFVHPQVAEYYQKAKKTFAVFTPHAFKPVRGTIVRKGAPPRKYDANNTFKIGILGGLKHWYKNVYGALVVAKEFAAHNPHTEILMAEAYDKPREAHLATVGHCSVLIHDSHLECYSNTIQEAWARGVPVITSPSCDGLTISNPLLSDEMKAHVSQLRMLNSTNPYEMYKHLESVRQHLDLISDEFYDVSKQLWEHTHAYNNTIFQSLIEGYKNREHDVELFESPFTKEGIDWQSMKVNL